jgi:hypothetical protein
VAVLVTRLVTSFDSGESGGLGLVTRTRRTVTAGVTKVLAATVTQPESRCQTKYDSGSSRKVTVIIIISGSSLSLSAGSESEAQAAVTGPASVPIVRPGRRPGLAANFVPYLACSSTMVNLG